MRARDWLPQWIAAALMYPAVLVSAPGCSWTGDAPARGADRSLPGDSGSTQARDTAGVRGSWTVSETGIGPVRAGMTVRQAETALGQDLLIMDTLGTCGYARPKDVRAGFLLMVVEGRIARVDVRDSSISTTVGARVGDSENRITSLYPGRVEVSPHKYTDGHYLIVTPAEPADSAYRIVFETDGRIVTRYRAGKLPEVEWVEGCA